MKISIITPVYNEKKYLPKLIKEIGKFKLPLIIVDDGSTDGGFDDMPNDNYVVLTHKVNLGKGAAMKTGAEYAFKKGADAVIFIDSDGQHNVSEIRKFIQRHNSGHYDLVLGSRKYDHAVPFVRYMGNKVASFIIRTLYNIHVTDSICGYRGLTKKGYKNIEWESAGYGVEIEMLVRAAKTKTTYCEVSVETIYHDDVKGVSVLDAFGILLSIIRWRLTI